MCRLPLTTNLSVSLIRSGIRQELHLCTYMRQCLEKLNQVGSTLYSCGWHLQPAVQINWEPKRKLLLCACLPLPIVDQYTFSVQCIFIVLWYYWNILTILADFPMGSPFHSLLSTSCITSYFVFLFKNTYYLCVFMCLYVCECLCVSVCVCTRSRARVYVRECILFQILMVMILVLLHLDWCLDVAWQ